MSLCFVASFVSHILGTRGPYVARQSPLSMGVSRQEYWGGLPCPSSGALLNSGIERVSPSLLHCRQILYLLSHLGSLLMSSSPSDRDRWVDSPALSARGSRASRRTSGWGQSPEEIRDVASWVVPHAERPQFSGNHESKKMKILILLQK